MQLGAGTRTRCPACSGAVPAGAAWCTQCWADLRPATEVTTGPGPQPAPVLPQAQAETEVPAPDTAGPQAPGVVAPPDRPTWPCTSCGTLTPLADDACAGCGAGFLAPLHEDGPVLVLPVVGDVARLRAGQRTAIAVGVVLLVVLLTLLLGVLLS